MVPAVFVLRATTGLFGPIKEASALAYIIVAALYVAPTLSILAARKTGVYLNSNTVMIALALSILQLVFATILIVIQLSGGFAES